MLSTSVATLSFNAPAMRAPATRSSAVTMFSAGDLSPSLGIKFSDVPTTCFGSLEAVPTFGWLQIMLFTCMQETGASPLAEAQTDDKEAGDIAIDSWVRYDDPETKTFKLNAERQNGRAAMLGITGCLVHELLGVDALYPTGGLGGAAPPAIF